MRPRRLSSLSSRIRRSVIRRRHTTFEPHLTQHGRRNPYLNVSRCPGNREGGMVPATFRRRV